jgi:hypothetical protein
MKLLFHSNKGRRWIQVVMIFRKRVTTMKHGAKAEEVTERRNRRCEKIQNLEITYDIFEVADC